MVLACKEEGTARAHFFSSHLEGMKRRLGSGASLMGWISTSRVNQSTSGSYGFTCARTRSLPGHLHSSLLQRNVSADSSQCCMLSHEARSHLCILHCRQTLY